ncbi:sugar phosphate isomerase/epimerase [soil metagenome]
MNRRYFLQKSALITAISILPMESIFARNRSLEKVGVQLFSLPRLLENDFRNAIKMIAEMGYKEVELFGPYSFSADSVKEQWEALSPYLGFSGSGFYGHSAREVKSILDEFGISAPSMHTDLETMQKNMDQLSEAAEVLGSTYIVLPAIPEEKRKNLDDYKRMADVFNEIGESARKAGLKFAYHNHGYGLQEMEGEIPFNIILDQTDPDLVFFEMDVFWTTAGGIDPNAYLKNHPNRYQLMHLKDMKEEVRFSGDGGDTQQWMELFPYMTSAGNGVLDLKAIIETAQQTGVKHFFIEQDLVKEPEVELQKSIDYLQSIGD